MDDWAAMKGDRSIYLHDISPGYAIARPAGAEDQLVLSCAADQAVVFRSSDLPGGSLLAGRA